MKLYRSLFMKVVLGAAMVAPMVTSCYDDSAIWDEIYEISSSLSELKNSLNGQIQAFNDLVAGGNITISECKRLSNGTCSITLSNGTKFTVLQEGKSLTGLVSYMEVDGVKYWAVYGEDGALSLLKGSDNQYIPVQDVVPYVEERNGTYYLVVGDEEYETGFDFDERSVITDYVLNKDESDGIYSVTFTFGSEDLTFTVPVDGYKGFTFRLGSEIIKELYVDYASTYQIKAGLDGVQKDNYVMQIPAGWRVRESFDDVTNELYLDITAPSKAKVESMDAEGTGDIKVVAVIEGGDAMVAKLALTTVPFKTLTTTSTNAIIEPYNGVDKYIYGISLVESYDPAALYAAAPEILSANDASNVSTESKNALISDILGSEVTPGQEYVLWAMPAFFRTEGEDAGYYVKEGVISTYAFGGSVMSVAVSEPKFNDATLDFSLQGAEAYYVGMSVKGELDVEEILYKLNNKLITPVTESLTYKGSVFSFIPEAQRPVAESEQSYQLWVVPAVDTKDEYREDDIVVKEFTLTGIVSGGTIEVSPGVATVTRTSVSVPLSAEGATRIYYIYMTERVANRVDAQDRADYLITNGQVVIGSEAVASVEKVDPNVKRVLFTMATDADGKYGPVKVCEYTTEKLEYNTLTIKATIESANIGQKKADVNLEVTGGTATDYVFWIGREIDDLWIAAGGTKDKMQQYLALYPDDPAVARAMYNGTIENGMLKLSGLKGETDYRLVILAQDETGLYSKAATCTFTTLAADLGVVVREGSSAWEAAKAAVQINWHTDKFYPPENENMSGFYAFDIKCPTDLTAYILCTTSSYINEVFETPEQRIIDIEAETSRKYDGDYVPTDATTGEFIQMPDWVDDSGNTHEGQLLSVYNFYVHGYPTNGFATYFAAGMHDGGHCTSLEGGSCSSYERAQQSIDKRLTIDYWKEYIANNRGSYCKMESVINKGAEDLLAANRPYYENAKPLIYENTGGWLYMEQHYAKGTLDDNGNTVDDVYIVFKDKQGNYYEPMCFDVPAEF